MFCQIFAALLLMTTTVARKETCEGTREYRYGDCECLEFIINPQVYWDDAERKCEVNGGHLVTIHEEGKQAFIADILTRISERNGVWLGMRRDEDDVFHWVDGKTVSAGYDAWADGEPDKRIVGQNCGMMHTNDQWEWKDYYCAVEEYSYICQYEACKVEEETSILDTNKVIGIVVGSVVGLICFFAILFLFINCCRNAMRRKRHNTPTVQLREVETASMCADEVHTSHPMLPPPEKATSQITNDLDRASVKKRKVPLITANVIVSASADQPPSIGQPITRDSCKISNISNTDSHGQGEQQRRNSSGSMEDNYLAANTNTDDHKNSSVDGVDKLAA